MSTDSELIERLRGRAKTMNGAASGDGGDSNVLGYYSVFGQKIDHEVADRIEALSRALAEAEKQRDEAVREARLDCDVTGAAHAVAKGPGGYTFCTKCGETIKYPTITERARAAEAKLRVAVEAQAKLSAFVRYVLVEGSWAGDGLDGGDAQDAAERFGLISPAPYDPAKHGYHVDFSDRDRWFKFTPLVLPLSSIGATTPEEKP
jgi:hypothetical protein